MLAAPGLGRKTCGGKESGNIGTGDRVVPLFGAEAFIPANQ